MTVYSVAVCARTTFLHQVDPSEDVEPLCVTHKKIYYCAKGLFATVMRSQSVIHLLLCEKREPEGTKGALKIQQCDA